jgi:hypothetical protein
MALFSECRPWCARKGLDTADIVREAWLHQQSHPTGHRTSFCPSFAHLHLRLFRLTTSQTEHSVPSNWGFQMSARLRAASLFTLIAVAAMSALPKIDLPETAFDETDAPTVQAVVATEAASSKRISSEAASAPIRFARTCNAHVRIVFPYTNQAIDLRQLREPLSTLRC